jgi:membrane associated rhomboid family serine protease/cytochrome c-type biogenesis protein CcmH/NrfG
VANCIKCGRLLPAFSLKKICQWCVQHEAAQRGELDDDAKQPVMAVPWTRRESGITLTQFFFGANIAVFLAMVFASGSVLDFPGQILVRFGANYGPWTLSGAWWRLFTYMFLHGGLMHIAFNMWCLWDLGALCESLYGRWTYAAVYLITGVAGGIASVAWNPMTLTVGASGAIFGLAGALIASFYLGEFSMPSFAIKGTLRSLVFFAGFNIFFGSLFPGIDNACHFGGLISGLILGAVIAKFAPHIENPMPRIFSLGLVVALVALAGFGVQRWRGASFRMEREMASLSESNPERSIAVLQTLVRQSPKSVQPHFLLGQAYFNQQNFPQAEAEFQRVLDLQSENEAARLDLGMVYLNEKRPEDAKALFTQLLAHDANDADAHYGMGLAFADEEKYQDAVSEFKTALAQGIQESGVYYDMGQSYAKLKMYDEAIAAYSQEQKKSGDDSEIESALAAAYHAKGMTQQAEDAQNKASQLKNARPHD